MLLGSIYVEVWKETFPSFYMRRLANSSEDDEYELEEEEEESLSRKIFTRFVAPSRDEEYVEPCLFLPVYVHGHLRHAGLQRQKLFQRRRRPEGRREVIALETQVDQVNGDIFLHRSVEICSFFLSAFFLAF